MTGFSQADAISTLKTAGLNPVVQVAGSPTVAKGLVISENPPTGTPLPLKTNVTIYVSSGPAAVPVPDLTNQSLADAKAELQRDKLTLGTITPKNSALAGKYRAKPDPQGGDDHCVGRGGQRGRRQRQQHRARRPQPATRRGRTGPDAPTASTSSRSTRRAARCNPALSSISRQDTTRRRRPALWSSFSSLSPRPRRRRPRHRLSSHHHRASTSPTASTSATASASSDAAAQRRTASP